MPKEIMKIKNSRISEILKEVSIYTNQPEKRNRIFKIALYYQLQNLTAEEKKILGKVLT